MRGLGIALAIAASGSIAAPAWAAGPYCKDYRTCEEAVRNWCAGRHAGADRDKDGIPCENVCRTLAEVKAIQASIGCRR